MSDDLRRELEAAYAAYRQALRSKDAEAFLAAAILPPQLPREMFMEMFEEFADDELTSGPDLADRQLVTIKTAGDDSAGYYAVWRPEDDPKAARLAMTVFRRTPDGWKVAVGGGTIGFAAAPGADLLETAMMIVESDEDMKLQPAGDVEPGGEPDTSLEAVLECMAYDCELSIAINGAGLKFQGGGSYGTYLFGAREGDSPREPNVLRAGENEIVVAYRRKADGPPTTLEIRVAAGACLKIVATRPAGKLAGRFTIPPVSQDASESGEPVCTEITDAESDDAQADGGAAAFENFTITPTDPRFAFRMDVPSGWVQPELPPLAAEGGDDGTFQPVGVFIAPYGVVVMTVAVRPVPPGTGTVAEMLVMMSAQQAVELNEIMPAQVGDIVGIGAMAAQGSNAGEMTVRLFMFEQGGWAWALLAMAPSEIWESLAEAFERMFTSFAVENPQPATIPPWPADGEM